MSVTPPRRPGGFPPRSIRCVATTVITAALLLLSACGAGASAGPREPSAPGVDAWVAYAPPRDPGLEELTRDVPAGLRLVRVTTTDEALAVGDTTEVVVWLAHDDDSPITLEVSPAFADPAYDEAVESTPSGERPEQGRKLRLKAPAWDPTVRVDPGQEAAVNVTIEALHPGAASFGLIMSEEGGHPMGILPVFEVDISP